MPVFAAATVPGMKAQRDSSLRRPTFSQERKRKKKSACSARNDHGKCEPPNGRHDVSCHYEKDAGLKPGATRIEGSTKGAEHKRGWRGEERADPSLRSG